MARHRLAVPKQRAKDGTPIRGVNLAGANQQTQSFPSVDELDYYISRGVTLFRYLLAWEYLQPTLGGPISEFQVQNVLRFVNDAAARGAKVMLDIHNSCYYSPGFGYGSAGSGAAITTGAQCADLWTKLAPYFKGNAGIFGYDIMNEPNGVTGFFAMPTKAYWPAYAQAVVTAIRAVDTTTTIVVEGDFFASAPDWTNTSFSNNNTLNISDPNNNLIYSAHMYFDADNSGVYANSYDVDGTTTAIGPTRLTVFTDWLTANGFKGIIGEYGIPNHNAQVAGYDSRYLAVLASFLSSAKTKKVWATYFAGGPGLSSSYSLSCQPYLYYSLPSNPVAATGITGGSGATFNLTPVITSASVAAPGVGWNPYDKSIWNIVLSNRNLTAANNLGATDAFFRGSPFQTSGKRYFEITVTAETSTHIVAGLANQAETQFDYVGQTNNSIGFYSGNVNLNNAVVASAPTFVQGDVLGFAVDLDNQKLFVRVNNGNWLKGGATQDPSNSAQGFSFAALGAVGTRIYPAGSLGHDGEKITINTGLSAFANAAPTGYSAWAASEYAPSGTYLATVQGGTGTPATLNVTIADGKVTAAALVSPGSYSILPANPVSVSGLPVGGSGALFNLHLGIQSASIASAGSGYTNGTYKAEIVGGAYFWNPATLSVTVSGGVVTAVTAGPIDASQMATIQAGL